ncbi:hypothetical protein A4G17_04375 [Frederiksenia canicola]|uniref:Uncharacterized protein n=1 Tax=Frederiksenia canicola TaxID=123824 RepID=A0AAE6X6C4_9PAST|nr:hypothetical protein A4G17_04375 [Frederiksenia canicola]
MNILSLITKSVANYTLFHNEIHALQSVTLVVSFTKPILSPFPKQKPLALYSTEYLQGVQ